MFGSRAADENISRRGRARSGGGFNTGGDWWTRSRTGAMGFDVPFDSARRENLPKLIELAAPGGRIAFYGAGRSETRRKLDLRPVSSGEH